jgi:UDP-N-acetylglucosamine:LPS N-acetylglucosamine transferase
MRILYLTFFFEPDLGAGSFRNTSLVKELSRQMSENDVIDVITTYPNRYRSYTVEAPFYEERGNIKVHRIKVPDHKNGFLDQIYSFKTYVLKANKITKRKNYDLVFVSSSRFFSAYLGYLIARREKIPLYVDMRDIFIESLDNALKIPVAKQIIMPFLKFIERKIFNYASHVNLISKGFMPYFKKFKCQSYSTYTHGIDNMFIKESQASHKSDINDPKVILYAGNIGKCQSLEKIIPPAAKLLGNEYQFVIIGDGKSKQKLLDEIQKENLTNVEIRKPIKREELIQLYAVSDFLFIHLEDHPAYERVIPSKIFEIGAFNKPIIAGVAGFAYNFMADNIPNTILFKPCDYLSMVELLRNYDYKLIKREKFIADFKRENINKEMALSILRIII